MLSSVLPQRSSGILKNDLAQGPRILASGPTPACHDPGAHLGSSLKNGGWLRPGILRFPKKTRDCELPAPFPSAGQARGQKDLETCTYAARKLRREAPTGCRRNPTTPDCQITSQQGMRLQRATKSVILGKSRWAGTRGIGRFPLAMSHRISIGNPHITQATQTGAWRSLDSASDWGSEGRWFKSSRPDL